MKKKLNQGWICPGCKKTYSPEIKTCEECNLKEKKDKKDEKLLEEGNNLRMIL